MQSFLKKIETRGSSSRAVDVLLQLSLELIEKQIKHCREVQFKVVEEESGEFERQIGCFESKKIEVLHALKDSNHPKREDYLYKMVKNIARNVAKLNANQPIDDDELKVVLCIFETQYF